MDDAHDATIYFAYGSDMSMEQMCQRCPDSTPIGLGFMPAMGWIINARGHANIVDMSEHGDDSPRPATSADGGVYGLMYLLPPRDDDKLDQLAGVPWAYVKVPMLAMRVGDENADTLKQAQRCEVLAYVDTKRTEGSVPRQDVADRMEKAITEAVQRWHLEEIYANKMREWLGRGSQ